MSISSIGSAPAPALPVTRSPENEAAERVPDNEAAEAPRKAPLKEGLGTKIDVTV